MAWVRTVCKARQDDPEVPPKGVAQPGRQDRCWAGSPRPAGL